MRALPPSMLRRALLPTLLLVLAAMALSPAGASAKTRIVGGANASVGQFPYQVMVKFDGDFACGGSILDSTHVATAAHCVVDFDNGDYPFVDDPDSYSVLYGGVDSDIDDTTTDMSEETVTRITVDRRYARRIEGDEYDSAILSLANPISFGANASPIAPATAANLATARGQASPQATVSGWGDTSDGGNVSDRLKFVKLPLDSDAACRSHYGSDFVASVMLCAGSPGKDTCQGDSGGPLKVDVGGAKLAGITSFGDGCGVYPGAYTKVSEAYTRSLLANPTHPAPPSPADSPTVSGTLHVGRDVTCDPPDGGTPSQYFWYLVTDDDVTQFGPMTRTVTLPPDAAGAFVACDVRLENDGGFAYAEMSTDDAVGPVEGNPVPPVRDRTKPKVRIRRIKCRQHRCKITIKASDRGGTVKHVAGVVNGKRRACRVRHGTRRCRLKGIRTKHLKLHKKRGGIYVARVKLRRGRYSVRVRSRDSSRNLSKRVRKRFRVLASPGFVGP